MTPKRFLSVVLGITLALPAWAEEITVVGTGDGVTILKSVAEAFMKANPGIVVTIPRSVGSSGGIKFVGNDRYALGRVARKIKDREKPYGLTYLPFAKVAVVFFVNKSVDVRHLTTRQILGIYDGTFTDWKDVGGSASRIRVVRREEGDSSLRILRTSLPGFGDIAITRRSKTATLTRENFAVVSERAGAIGFGPYPDALAADVVIQSINGKPPADPGYPIFETLALIFKEANRKGAIAGFIEFIRSPAAKEIIRRGRGVPIG